MEEKQTPEWLQNLQESSWELELLISGGAIFSLIQASDFLIETAQSLNITTGLVGTSMLLLFATLGVKILTVGFILHLALRAFWVSLVCANYVYPGGVQTRKIKWKRPFKINVAQNSDLYELILGTNKLCSTVMYLSIISSFILAGYILVSLVLVTLPSSLFKVEHTSGWNSYFSFFSWVSLFYFLDLFTFGSLRRVPYLSYLVFPFFRLFDLLSFRFVYQKALWVYNTNVQKWKFLLAMTIFVTVAFFYSYGSLYKVMRWNNVFDQREFRFQLADNPVISYGYYKDELGDELINGVVIPSKLIEEDVLELFLVYRRFWDEDFKKENTKNRFLSDLALIKIDDSVYQHLEWFPTWNRDNDQLGITSMIPIKDLKEGAHVLTIQNKKDTVVAVTIPFWKVPK